MIETKENKKLFLVLWWLGIIGFPFFCILDSIYYPHHIITLVTIRLSFVIYAWGTLLLLPKIPVKHIDSDILGIPGSIAISLMCYFTEGFSSAYFGGNMLIILAASMLTINFTRYVISLVTILAFHFICLMFYKPFNLQGFFAHIFFLGYAAIMGFIIKLLIDKTRQRELLANQKNEYFVKVFAHDIKNHLTAGIGILQIYMQSPGKKYLQEIVDNEKEMNRMVINLMNLFSEEKITLNKEKILSTELIDIIKKHWAEAFRSKNITFTSLVDSSHNIQVDKNYMMLVFDNLLSNAFQQTPNNGKVIIKIYYDKEFSYILFLNSGELVPQDSISTIFEQYLTPEKQTAYHKGLGLNYSKMMCKLHNGDLTYSVYDNMNAFTVKIPQITL